MNDIREFLKQEIVNPSYGTWSRDMEVALLKRILKKPRNFDYDVQILAKQLLAGYLVYRIGLVEDGKKIDELSTALSEAETEMVEFMENYYELKKLSKEKGR